jgi:hypothetical protein
MRAGVSELSDGDSVEVIDAARLRRRARDELNKRAEALRQALLAVRPHAECAEPPSSSTDSGEGAPRIPS